MRQFASAGFRLWNLSKEAKVIYTFFCALSLLALISSLALYEDLVGPTLREGPTARVRAYYADETPPAGRAAPAAPAPTGGGGPEIALPGEDEVAAAPAPTATGALTITMPYRKLLEVTHFHLFTVPVFLLILTHLFMLTGASRRQKMLWIWLGWIGGSAHILAPWLIRLGGGRWALSFPLSGGMLLVSGLVLTLYPAVVMWRQPAPRRPGRASAGTGAAADSGAASDAEASAE